MKNTLLIVLGILVLFLGFRTANLNRAVIKLKADKATLEDNLKTKTVITKDRLVYVYRDSDNKPKQEEIYVPPMGNIEIKNPQPPTVNGVVDKLKCGVFQKSIDMENGIICVTNKGFGLKPGIVSVMSKEPEIGLGLSLAYWDRYITGIGFGHRQTAFVYGGRHISDIIPFAPNTALIATFGKNLKEQDTRLGIGLLVHF